MLYEPNPKHKSYSTSNSTSYEKCFQISLQTAITTVVVLEQHTSYSYFIFIEFTVIYGKIKYYRSDFKPGRRILFFLHIKCQLYFENGLVGKKYVNGANTSFIKCLKCTSFVVLLSLALSMITIDSGFYDCMSRRR